jgi:hypothetical protein
MKIPSRTDNQKSTVCSMIKKYNQRLQSENGLFCMENMNIIVYSAIYYMHLIVSYGNGGNKLFVFCICICIRQ